MSIYPLYVASDLHIGDHGPRDNFTKVELPIENSTRKASRDKQFRAFLNHVKNDGGRLLLIGDVFEFWQSNIGDVLSRNIELINEMGGMDNLEILLGNHDIDLKGLIEEPRIKLKDAHPIFSRIISTKRGENKNPEIHKKSFKDPESGRERTYGFIHGNEIDAFNNSPTPGAGRAIAILAGIIEDGIGSPFLKDSNILVEKDLENKAMKLKSGILPYIISKVFSRQSMKILVSLAAWVLIVIASVISLFFSSANAWIVISTLLLVIAPIVIAAFIGQHLLSPIKDGTNYISGNLREYLKIWTDKLPQSKSSTHDATPKEIEAGNDKIINIMKNNQCDMMILGHTHIDEITEYGCNTGTWVNEKPSFLKIYPNGCIELYRWQASSDETGAPILRKRLSFRNEERIIEEMEKFSNPDSREGNLGCLSSIPGA